MAHVVNRKPVALGIAGVIGRTQGAVLCRDLGRFRAADCAMLVNPTKQFGVATDDSEFTATRSGT